MRLANKLKTEYENILIARGEEYFYKYAIGSGFMERVVYDTSEVLVLDRAEAFFKLYRQTGNDNYFTIGKVLRKAAHRLYRNRIKSMEEPEVNTRFLRIVK